jgi:hypothetical protein
MKIAKWLLLPLLLIMAGCWKFNVKPKPGNDNFKVMGYKPIYSTDPALKQIASDTPRPVKNAGKIYAWQNYLLQCEVGEGIHIIDKSVPANARRVSFIRVIGANDISIKDGFLYTNSYKDVVVINISNINQPTEVKRIPNAFNVSGYLPEPPIKRVAYECVDLSKGVVTGWVQDSVAYYQSCYNF